MIVEQRLLREVDSSLGQELSKQRVRASVAGGM